jgi:hypothetical protein
LLCFLALFAIPAVVALLLSRDESGRVVGLPLLIFWLFTALTHLRRQRWLWRFSQAARSFRTMHGDRLVLHYAPAVSSRRTPRDLRILIQHFQVILDELAQRFGKPLPSRVVIYLFADHSSLARGLGRQVGGTALAPFNAIVISDSGCVEEVMRHEFVHLFSFGWNPRAVPLLEEGLAVCLQETRGGQPIDAAARRFFADQTFRLSRLLDRRFFFAEPHVHVCYLLAGSFTGFLLRRFGWKHYRKFYRMADARRFESKFQKCFGVNLEDAERQWRDHVLALEVLKRRLGKRNCY